MIIWKRYCVVVTDPDRLAKLELKSSHVSLSPDSPHPPPEAQLRQYWEYNPLLGAPQQEELPDY